MKNNNIIPVPQARSIDDVGTIQEVFPIIYYCSRHSKQLLSKHI